MGILTPSQPSGVPSVDKLAMQFEKNMCELYLQFNTVTQSIDEITLAEFNNDPLGPQINTWSNDAIAAANKVESIARRSIAKIATETPNFPNTGWQKLYYQQQTSLLNKIEQEANTIWGALQSTQYTEAVNLRVLQTSLWGNGTNSPLRKATESVQNDLKKMTKNQLDVVKSTNSVPVPT